MEYLKVEGHNSFIRDPKSNSIINVNTQEYNEYLTRKQKKTKEIQKIHSLEEEVANMKEDLQEIKSLLRRMINEHG
jgi:hypothetical protein